ncbi:hypothetical protein GCM10010251_27970 [Streptomyces aurantiogriseus]|uniref:Uncharacterized protein n=1 Tax=Streptomyces aurantiogriseus TaxID=66870 RepID=A0A918C7E6_9ACTN|nr:hypothetical protein GCM10010251_27970 [Streptomyces aurantiogriseus]
MCFDRAFLDVQSPGDLRVAQCVPQEREYVPFSGREAVGQAYGAGVVARDPG